MLIICDDDGNYNVSTPMSEVLLQLTLAPALALTVTTIGEFRRIQPLLHSTAAAYILSFFHSH